MFDMEVASFVVSSVTAICALYIAYVSLAHSAKPAGSVRLVGRPQFVAGEEAELKFAFINRGHWYAKPPIVELNAWMNFDPSFDLLKVRYGSALELWDDNVRIGKGGLKFLKAKGMKISHGGGEEPVSVTLRCPATPGRYLVKVDAFSDNGAAIRGRWVIRVRKPTNGNAASAQVDPQPGAAAM